MHAKQSQCGHVQKKLLQILIHNCTEVVANSASYNVMHDKVKSCDFVLYLLITSINLYYAN